MAKSKAKLGNFFQEDERIWGVERRRILAGLKAGSVGLSSGVQVGAERQPGPLENTQYCVTRCVCAACGPGPCKIKFGAPTYPDVDDNLYMH